MYFLFKVSYEPLLLCSIKTVEYYVHFIIILAVVCVMT